MKAQTNTPLNTREALNVVCQCLEKQYQEEQATLLAKIKMTQFIRQANPLPTQFQNAWATIQNRSETEAQAIAILTLEIQKLLTLGKTSELW